MNLKTWGGLLKHEFISPELFCFFVSNNSSRKEKKGMADALLQVESRQTSLTYSSPRLSPPAHSSILSYYLAILPCKIPSNKHKCHVSMRLHVLWEIKQQRNEWKQQSVLESRNFEQIRQSLICQERVYEWRTYQTHPNQSNPLPRSFIHDFWRIN